MTGLTEDNPQEALRILLHRLNTKFTDYSIQELKQHPNYPSLLAINYTLNQLRIDNIAVRGTYEQLLHEFPKPLLVHTRENGGTYQVVDCLDEEQVWVVNKKGALSTQPKEEFMQAWSGVAMLVDEHTKGIESDYTRNRIKGLLSAARLPLTVLSGLLLLFYVSYYTTHLTSVFDYLFLATKALGIAVTLPLVVRSVDQHSGWANRLCLAGSEFDCGSILDTPAARLWGLFSWSDIGFLYFTVLFSYLLLFPVHADWLVVGLSLLSAPFTVYSVYYQARVAKQWCRLCLAVQGVLLLELGLAATLLLTGSPAVMSIQNGVGFVLAAGILVSAYSYLKPVLAEWYKLKQERPFLNQVKFKEAVFQTLLRQQPAIDTTSVDSIQLGHPEGRHQLIIISNPTCGPCRDAHQQLMTLIKRREDVSLQEILLVHHQQPGYQAAERMLALYRSNPEQAKKAITAYYEQDAATWMRQYQGVNVDDDVGRILFEQLVWCGKNGITETPTILYNGYRLPPEYRIEDLDYLLD